MGARTAPDLRWTTTPTRLAERLNGFAKRADAIGASSPASQLRSLARKLRRLPCRRTILDVASELGETFMRTKAAAVEERNLAPVLVIWREAHDLASHPRRLNQPGGIALLTPEARREMSELGRARQPAPGSPEALERAAKAMETKRARGTVYVFTDEQRRRGQESRRQIPAARRSEIARTAVAAREARRGGES